MSAKNSRRCFLCVPKSNASLHLFPKEPTSVCLWKRICNLQENENVSKLFVCSEHFTADDYYEPNAKKIGGKLRLKPAAYPSLCVPNKVKVSTKNQDQAASSTSCDNQQLCVREKRKLNEAKPLGNKEQSSLICGEKHKRKKRKFNDAQYFGEVASPDVTSPNRSKRAMVLGQQQVRHQKLKIRALEQKNRRLRKKVISLQELVNHLRQKNILSEDAGDTIMVTKS